MNRSASTWLRPMPLAATGLASLALVVWFVGPLLSIDVDRPLETQSARIALIGVAVVLWIAAQGWRRWRRWHADDALWRSLQATSGEIPRDATTAPPWRDWRSSIGLERLGRGWAWATGGRILERPWFLLIGESRADMARVIEGLGPSVRLPRASEHASGPEAASAGSVPFDIEGWVFDNAAVVGAAVMAPEPTPDPMQGASAASTPWSRLFARLEALRPRRSIDGVILLVSAVDLLRYTADPQDARGSNWLVALHDLGRRLRARIPVYLVITQVDRIDGFAETFGDLDAGDRQRPWGFDLAQEHRRADGRTTIGAPLDLAFARLDQALRDRCTRRMDASSDPAARASIFMFTHEFGALETVLRAGLSRAADGERTGGDFGVRGVYFTGGSGAPDLLSAGPVSPPAGSPPVSTRSSRALQRSFGIEPVRSSLRTQRSGAAGDFFMARLLGDVLLADAGLQRRRLLAGQRRAQWRWGGYALLALAAAALVSAWLVSFSRNMSYVADVRGRPAEIRRSIDALPPAVDGDVTSLPAVLSAVRNLAAPDDFPVDQPPLLNSFGLYQGDKLDVAAVIGYEHLLDHALMPRLSHRLEERLRAAGSDDPEQAYEALKSYLMVYTPDKFDAESLGAWIRADWDDASRARLAPDQRAALDRHLDALLRRGAPKAVVPIDMALVTRTRELLADYPLENRVYSRLKRLGASTSLPDFTVAGAAGPLASTVFARASGQPISRGIPGFYTRDGYSKAFQASIEPLALQLANEESWVLGIGAGDGRGGVAGAVNAAEAAAKRAREVAGGQLSNRVRRLYFDDFIRQWDAYIADMRLANVDSLEKARLLAQALSGTDSPLLSLTRAIARETTLTPGPADRTAALSTALDKAAANRNDAARLSGTAPSAADAGAPSVQVEKMVDDHFAAFHRLVEGKRPPIEQSLRLFDRLNAQLSEIDLAQRRRTALPSPLGLFESRSAAAGQIEPIRSMLQSLVGAGLSALSSTPAGASTPGATRAPRSP